MQVLRAFLYNLYEHNVKFPFGRWLEGLNTGTNLIYSPSPNLGTVPKTP